MGTDRRVGTRACTSASVVAVDPSKWPTVDEAALPEDRRRQFQVRKRAILLYLGGATAAQLSQDCGMSRTNVYRIVAERCLAQHEDGTLMAWRGALPYLRVQEYRRLAAPIIQPTGGSAVGALQWMFSSPGGQALEKRFRAQILGKRPPLESHMRPEGALFNWLVRELRAAGHESRGEWKPNGAQATRGRPAAFW